MFGRRCSIAWSFLLFLLVMSFLIGAAALNTLAVWSSITHFASAIAAEFVILWPGEAPIIAAIFAGLFGWAIAEFYTKRLKQIEATLEFSKRFHELIQQQGVLNRKYVEVRLNGKVAPALDAIDKEDANDWWWRIFDLLAYEYDFYQKGMVRKARFEEWMVWRWYDFHPEPGKEWKTCGIAYKDAWATWKKHPAQPSRLIELLDEIHAISVPPNTKDGNRVLEKIVRDKVKRHGPRWFKLTDLDKASR
jgi:hypothetical protein